MTPGLKEVSRASAGHKESHWERKLQTPLSVPRNVASATQDWHGMWDSGVRSSLTCISLTFSSVLSK